ncbi:chemotaxis-specific protein-glutamate methyltransferase CheB [Sphingomonas arenae]|uniref:chemotaxis-specific protein-glutamate methyltransferase CheB n=1 Tax=Sphingomonas arenae TaxID=2812555 RepID=UPI001F009704|nr:chemotaxis-specific protein-glutamate methyltransferase CheB [Sphingomonas arenae]
MSPALATRREGVHRPTRPIRLMIVDDSMVARAVLSRMIESDGGFEIVAVAGTAEHAVDALAHVRVDVVLLDLEMPGAGGLTMIPKILATARGARVIVVSSLAEEGAEETIAALALGAADTLPKPGTGRFNGRFSEVLLSKLRALGHAEDRVEPARSKQSPSTPLRAMSNDALGVLAIGASTGGIHSLGTFFQALPPVLGVPILVTQHLPVPFMEVFARQLGTSARREARIAQEGMELLPDQILIAPGDAHLTVESVGGCQQVHLMRQSVSSGCLPSLDPMLASLGPIYGTAAVAVVLSGMGRDGTEGAAKLVACGGAVIAQDEASSAVWGMPRAVAEAGLACAILPPDKIARRVASRAGDVAWK